MKTDFNKTYDRKGTNCFKWDKNIDLYGKEEVISLWVADMDLPTCSLIKDEIKKRAEHPLFGYTFRNEEYFDAFINWQKKRNNWEINRDWILNSTSVVVSINLFIRTFTDPGDDVLIISPVYSQFAATISDTQRNLVSSSLINNSDQFDLDFEDIENKLATGIKVLVFCSPHNPVGRVWTKSELTRLGNLCRKYNTLIISDEIHSDLVFPPHQHTPLASISPEIADITLTCFSPGKSFNLSGLSISFIVCSNHDIRESIRKTFLSYHLMAANIFGITACHTAFAHCEPWLEQLISHLKMNRDYLVSFINDNIPLIDLKIPQGTYLAWLDFSKLKLSQKQLQCFLVQVAGLGLDNGTKYGKEGEGFMRLNFAISMPLLVQVMNNLKSAVDKLVNAQFDLAKLIDVDADIEDCD